MSECCDTQPPRFLAIESILILSDPAVCIFSCSCYPSASRANHVIPIRVSSKIVPSLIYPAQTSSKDNLMTTVKTNYQLTNFNTQPTKISPWGPTL